MEMEDAVKLKKWNAVALWAYDTTGGAGATPDVLCAL